MTCKQMILVMKKVDGLVVKTNEEKIAISNIEKLQDVICMVKEEIE